MSNPIHIRRLGLRDYVSVWQEMQRFTLQRGAEQEDELWCVEHPAVFTQGRNGKSEHLLNTEHDIPIVESDRGGQITYHGPGQAVVYALIDLKRRKLGVRDLVSELENTVIRYLAQWDISAEARRDAPGVYVPEGKIASLGLRVRRGCSYHGLSFNVNMDLTPFTWINPCGLYGQKVTQLRHFGIDIDTMECGHQLASLLVSALNDSPAQ